VGRRRARARVPAEPQRTPERRPAVSTSGLGERFAPVGIALAGLVAYHNAFSGPFVLDDVFGIQNNASIRALWPAGPIFDPPPHSPVADRPVVNLSLALNYALGGLDPTSYHVFNVALHVLSALVVFALVKTTLLSAGPGNPGRGSPSGIAASVALLWVVHPLTTESVDYTIQRTELLMGLFFLLTLLFAANAFRSPNRPGREAAALAAFALGLASKEVIAVAPVVVLAYDRLFVSPSFGRALRRHRRLYLGYAAVLVLFVVVLGTRLRRVFAGASTHLSPWDYALTQSGVIVRYLRLAIWPAPLVADYEDWPIATSIGSVLPGIAIVLTLLALTAWGLFRGRKLAFLGVWFFAILAPTSSFRPIAAEVAAERRMYLPLISVVVLAVLGGDALFRRVNAPKAARLAAVGLVAGLLVVVTVRRNEDYATTLRFWSDIVEKRPGNARARIWLGKHFHEEGRTADAVRHLSEAVRLRPANAEARYGLGVALASAGRADEAIAQYREALRIRPGDASAHNNLGSALQGRGDVPGAIEHFREALRIRPDHFNAHCNLALALADQGLLQEAIAHAETAVRLRPDSATARDLRAQLLGRAAR
jgi:Flp pilus assembly protein TadD